MRLYSILPPHRTTEKPRRSQRNNYILILGHFSLHTAPPPSITAFCLVVTVHFLGTFASPCTPPSFSSFSLPQTKAGNLPGACRILSLCFKYFLPPSYLRFSCLLLTSKLDWFSIFLNVDNLVGKEF